MRWLCTAFNSNLWYTLAAYYPPASSPFQIISYFLSSANNSTEMESRVGKLLVIKGGIKKALRQTQQHQSELVCIRKESRIQKYIASAFWFITAILYHASQMGVMCIYIQRSSPLSRYSAPQAKVRLLRNARTRNTQRVTRPNYNFTIIASNTYQTRSFLKKIFLPGLISIPPNNGLVKRTWLLILYQCKQTATNEKLTSGVNNKYYSA